MAEAVPGDNYNSRSGTLTKTTIDLSLNRLRPFFDQSCCVASVAPAWSRPLIAGYCRPIAALVATCPVYAKTTWIG